MIRLGLEYSMSAFVSVSNLFSFVVRGSDHIFVDVGEVLL
jgi:hypothetical protein